MKALVLAAALGFSCGRPTILEGKPAEVFRAITKHDTQAVTVSDKTVFYGGKVPPSDGLKCHEEVGHMKGQVEPLCHWLRGANYIDDDELSCAAVWIFIYGMDYAVHGANNRFEKGARAACGQSSPSSP